MNATTIWQLDVYWEDDGPDYDETGREVLHTFEQKPDVNQLRTVLEANNIFAHDSNIAALLDSSGVLMNTQMDCCQLTEVTYSMSRVYRVIGATEDEHCNETYIVADSETEARSLWESDYKDGEYTHIMRVDLTTERVEDYL